MKINCLFRIYYSTFMFWNNGPVERGKLSGKERGRSYWAASFSVRRERLVLGQSTGPSFILWFQELFGGRWVSVWKEWMLECKTALFWFLPFSKWKSNQYQHRMRGSKYFTFKKRKEGMNSLGGIGEWMDCRTKLKSLGSTNKILGFFFKTYPWLFLPSVFI